MPLDSISNVLIIGNLNLLVNTKNVQTNVWLKIQFLITATQFEVKRWQGIEFVVIINASNKQRWALECDLLLSKCYCWLAAIHSLQN